MGEYSREQRNQLSRAVANSESQSGQLKVFVDNRQNINSTLQLSAVQLTTDFSSKASIHNLQDLNKYLTTPLKIEDFSIVDVTPEILDEVIGMHNFSIVNYYASSNEVLSNKDLIAMYTPKIKEVIAEKSVEQKKKYPIYYKYDISKYLDDEIIKSLAKCEYMDRHRGNKPNTPLHQHLDGGKKGFAFAYVMCDEKKVPYVYDYASSRTGNTFDWQSGVKQSGPTEIPPLSGAKEVIVEF